MISFQNVVGDGWGSHHYKWCMCYTGGVWSETSEIFWISTKTQMILVTSSIWDLIGVSYIAVLSDPPKKGMFKSGEYGTICHISHVDA